ncbi:hypothetical protein M441DRAFT_62342 [Trichoderma asperellum CBS 433.97]|uniref:Uncharacterized protein n=1 Tax=Trichoderma asperellum (strain ATCC 204424 / CBS 433.97 / NBRC 101777) TaxID=1042311 RepID=A0A2T3YTR1_TRIA4|nr:hypothetical protein M441DRAFT_62342 [Trichoderma asperellum CBS 433.97]PTB35962.1 hypothetical protein M441DRAFT_62342 [Trichoderma asperellum CBS 433.97]
MPTSICVSLHCTRKNAWGAIFINRPDQASRSQSAMNQTALRGRRLQGDESSAFCALKVEMSETAQCLVPANRHTVLVHTVLLWAVYVVASVSK